MANYRILWIMIDAFLDGISGAGLFGKLRPPGAPTVLMDERTEVDASPRRFWHRSGYLLI
jgi:hypothetical protein